MTIWTMIALSVNAISIFTVYYDCAFRLKSKHTFEAMPFVFEVILIIEMLLFFFKAYPAKESPRGFLFSIFKTCGLCREKEEAEAKVGSKENRSDIMWQRKFRLIAFRYLSGNFLTDFLSVVPFFIGKLNNLNGDY